MAKHLDESISLLLPKSYVKTIKELVIFSKTKKKAVNLISSTIKISFYLSVIFFLISYFFNFYKLIFLISGILIIPLSLFMLYILLYFKADSRKSDIENALPDALQLIASNLQAGLTPFEAIKAAGRKEFGALAHEFKEATSKAMGLANFSDELMKITQRVDSVLLKRTLKLITSSINSGSHLAILLEELSEDIADNQSLKKEMVTNTKTYTMFIMFTIIVGAPLLLAISVHFVGMVQEMQSSATLSTDEFGLGFLGGEIEITPEFLTNISIIVLTLTSLLATMLTGTITKGEMKAGLKFAPFVIAGSIILFYISKIIIAGFFNSLG
jgi:Flp pilus assembly protein TadB